MGTDGGLGWARLSPTSPSRCFLPQEWLSRFGYLPPGDVAAGQLQTQEELAKAIGAMQRFAGLEATGVLGQSRGPASRFLLTLPIPGPMPPSLPLWSRG